MKLHGRAWLALTFLALAGGAARTFAVDAHIFKTQEAGAAVAQSDASGVTVFQATTISIPTYQYASALRTRYNGVYAYRWLDWDNYNPSLVTQDYQLLVLENDYLRVTILPELGGRVYQMIYKATGNNELYQNPVIKPTHWGPAEQGWWLAAGGIEWGLPVDEHGYEWGEPWAWSAITSTAGVTVTVRDTDAPNRLRAAIDLFLPAERAYLAITPHLENPTPQDLSYKYWTDAMLAPGPANTVSADLRFIFNADEMAVHSTGDDRRFPCAGWTQTGPDCRFSWPVYNGRDFSRLENWREWLGFFEYPQAAADFIGVYDAAVNEGVARVFPSQVARGAKGFGMGWRYPLDWGIWTDNDPTFYVELHGGVAPAFWDWATLAAGTTLAWTEYWYPVGDIGVFTDATSEAALAAQQDGENFHIGLHSTVARPNGQSSLYVWDRTSCAQAARWDVAVDPAHPFTVSMPRDGRTLDQLAVAYVDGEGNLLAGSLPPDHQPPLAKVEPLPSWVATTAFTVTWSAQDDCTGVAAYDVQVRDGYEGGWTDWLTGATANSAVYTGTHGHTYFFRARAWDMAKNQGAFGDGEWGQAFTTVLTEAAPVLVTSRKEAASPNAMPSRWVMLQPGESVAYTLLLSNTGSLAAPAALTDLLPPQMVLLPETLIANRGPSPVYAGDAIRWSGTLDPGETVRLSYVLSPTASLQSGDRVTNTVQLTGSVLGTLEREAVAVYAWSCWLPMLVRQ